MEQILTSIENHPWAFIGVSLAVIMLAGEIFPIVMVREVRSHRKSKDY